MKTFKQFQEQLQRGNVTPAQIPSPEQNRKRVSDAAKSRRSLVNRFMHRTSLPYKKRHDKRMADLLSSPHHTGMHGEEVSLYEISAVEFGKSQDAYEKSVAASTKLAARRKAAQSDPTERGKEFENKAGSDKAQQIADARARAAKQQSSTEKPPFRRLLDFSKKDDGGGGGSSSVVVKVKQTKSKAKPAAAQAQPKAKPAQSPDQTVVPAKVSVINTPPSAAKNRPALPPSRNRPALPPSRNRPALPPSKN